MGVEDLKDTVVPRSDQLNADDLLTGPITATVTAVKRGDMEQPVVIHLDGYRPYKPCKTMRRVLIAAWGDDGRAWVGRSMTLYCDPEVRWGGVKVGGIRISHLSHIDGDLSLVLTVTRGKRKPYRVQPLRTTPSATTAASPGAVNPISDEPIDAPADSGRAATIAALRGYKPASAVSAAASSLGLVLDREHRLESLSDADLDRLTTVVMQQTQDRG